MTSHQPTLDPRRLRGFQKSNDGLWRMTADFTLPDKLWRTTLVMDDKGRLRTEKKKQSP